MYAYVCLLSTKTDTKTDKLYLTVELTGRATVLEKSDCAARGPVQ